MSDIVIKAENIGKKYTIGHQAERERDTTFREVIVQNARNLWHKTRDLATGRPIIQGESLEEVWALKDVSFEIRRGEAVGIIGRNGAGKSTLLKILSRITEPTEGRVTIKGRVASLLEVGTGFHSELSGRENIYLNGAILGMTRAEIKRKFDEIVAFAEVGKYLDTPVKRYSSGMYVRLAFAVAAHLEPEILVVDEVLAVGDASFQKKCLGKMDEVAKQQGRTVLFVSHNMAAIQNLCQQVILLSKGRLVSWGETTSVISHYLAQGGVLGSAIHWSEDAAPGNNNLRLLSMTACSEDGSKDGVYQSQKKIYIEMTFKASEIHSALCVGFDLITEYGVTVLRSYHTDMEDVSRPEVRKGINTWMCAIPAGLLNGGVYTVSPRISLHNISWIVMLDAVLKFEVVLNHGVSSFWHSLDSRSRPGTVSPILKWKVD